MAKPKRATRPDSTSKRDRTQARKALRRNENEARHAANIERRKRGEPTPWDIARANRRERRKQARETTKDVR